MRVAVVAGPDAGHVFPSVALCLRFAAAGDEPVLLTADGWREAAVAAGVEAPRLADRATQYLVILAVGSGSVTFSAWYVSGGATAITALTFAI